MKLIASQKGWRLRDAPFPFQQTYVTPLPELSRFVHTLLRRFEIDGAIVRVETIVFTPDDLIQYLNSVGVRTDSGLLDGAIIEAETALEASKILEGVLGDWIDFAFITSPEKFAIYADHDEYTTVFTASSELLDALREDMESEGFKAVDNWLWVGSHSVDLTEEGRNA